MEFLPDGVPKWAVPYFGDLAFDRYFTGILYDPFRDLDLPSLSISLDGDYDLSGYITYKAEELPDGSLLFHWQCDIPFDLKDSAVHELTGKVGRENGGPVEDGELVESVEDGELVEPVQMVTWENLAPLQAPAISFAVYPWRNIQLESEDQKEDPLKILVVMDSEIRPEWVDALSDPKVWYLSSVGYPVSAEVAASLGAITLSLEKPLTETTTLTLGPIELEKYVTVEGEYDIWVADGEELLLTPCWCGFQIQDDHHDLIEAEPFGMAYRAVGSGVWCLLPGPDECRHEMRELLHELWNNYSINEDASHISDDVINAGTFPTPFMNRWRTLTADRWYTHYYYMEYDDILDQYCDASEPVILEHSFAGIDMANPYFVEEPRLAYGPEVAQWLMPYYQSPEPSVHYSGMMQPPSTYAEDLCGIYVLAHVKDAVALALGITVLLDVKKNDIWEQHFLQGTPNVGIWIDNDVPSYMEYEDWDDTETCDYAYCCNGHFFQDFLWQQEEFLVPIEVTDLIADSTVTEIRVRITDHTFNWKRSDNLKPQNQDDMPIDFLGLMFRDPLRYPDLPCHSGEDDARVSCDGYVAPRPDGSAVLDVCAMLRAANPPNRIKVELSAPGDEGGGDEHIQVYLYRLELNASEWDAIAEDFDCLTDIQLESSPCLEIYCRNNPEGTRVFYGLGEDQPYPISVSDSADSSPTSYQENDYEISPVLYVSDNDSQIAEQKDYAIAVASDWHFLQDQGWLAGDQYNHAPDYFQYGALRGWCDAVGGSSHHGECDPPNGYIEGFSPNVTSFGFEYVQADMNNWRAYYPVQSEADIMLVHSHGMVDDNDLSYMMWFPDSRLSEFGLNESPNQTPETVIYASEWAGYFERDAQWLATTSCWLLGDSLSTSVKLDQYEDNPNAYPAHSCDPWRQWQDLTQFFSQTPTSLKSILGWRWIHSTRFSNSSGFPYVASDEAFWERFSELLNEDDYPGVAARWADDTPSDEYSVRCYMEAGWEFYRGVLDSMHGSYLPYESDFRDFMLAIAAVDEGHRYTLAETPIGHNMNEIKIRTLGT